MSKTRSQSSIKDKDMSSNNTSTGKSKQVSSTVSGSPTMHGKQMRSSSLRASEDEDPASEDELYETNEEALTRTITGTSSRVPRPPTPFPFSGTSKGGRRDHPDARMSSALRDASASGTSSRHEGNTASPSPQRVHVHVQDRRQGGSNDREHSQPSTEDEQQGDRTARLAPSMSFFSSPGHRAPGAKPRLPQHPNHIRPTAASSNAGPRGGGTIPTQYGVAGRQDREASGSSLSSSEHTRSNAAR